LVKRVGISIGPFHGTSTLGAPSSNVLIGAIEPKPATGAEFAPPLFLSLPRTTLGDLETNSRGIAVFGCFLVGAHLGFLSGDVY
jgi:hypothetical protein